MALSRQSWIQRLPLVLFELLNKSVLHLIEETAVKLIPLSCLQIALFEDRCLAEHVDLAAYV